MKLLSSINALCDFVLCPYKGIDYYIEKYTMKHPIKKKEVKDEDPIDEIANTLKLEFKEKTEFKNISNSLVNNKSEQNNIILNLRKKALKKLFKYYIW